MVEIKSCPSSLAEGFNTYSPKSAKLLFGKTKVNSILGFDIDGFRNVGEIADATAYRFQAFRKNFRLL